MDNTALQFSIALKSRPVILDGTEYTLKELTGSQRDAHFAFMGKAIKTTVGPDGKPVANVQDYKDLQTHILTLCLYDKENKPVKVEVIREWPATVITALNEAAREISGLNKDSEAEAKKE